MKGMLRPDAVVLADGAFVPRGHHFSPPPNQFTHELTRSEPFRFTGEEEAPSGELPAGARVVLLAYDGGTHCHVADERGLYVQVEYGALRKLAG